MDSTDWRDQPMLALVEHILHAFHAPLRENLPRLEALARQATGDDPGSNALARILELVLLLCDELEIHMQKEEQVLFPMLLSGHGSDAHGPMMVMEADHDAVLGVLGELAMLTDVEVPEHPALWAALAGLDRDLRAHIALESDILHPRARAE
jgi:regulator of cell morphogenesis and NO signaling